MSSTPLRVLEVSSGVAGAYCCWLLHQMGAEVRRVDPSAVPGYACPDHGDLIRRSLAFYSSNKRSLHTANANEALTASDLVVTDDAVLFSALTGRKVPEMAAAQPGAVFGVASVFGLSGPLADVPSVPLNAQAEAGVCWALGEAGRTPLSIPPGILECQAGAHLAAACLMALLAGPGQAAGRVVDIALNDVLTHYVGVNCRFYVHHGMQWRREGRRAAYSGGAYPFVILPCADGSVCLSGRTRQEWERFVHAMGTPAWSQEPRYQKLRAMGQQYPEEVDALVIPWLAEHTKAEIGAIADRFRLTIAPLQDLNDVVATPQLSEREFLRQWGTSEQPVSGPSLPFRVAAKRSDQQAPDLANTMLVNFRRGKDRESTGPLAGLRVLDMGWVWSAPQAGSILAQLGAEVIKVEHSGRLDNARLSGPVIRDGERVDGDTENMSPMFHQINKAKRAITLNLKDPEGIKLFKQLAQRCDIVVENMSAGSLERSGVGYDTLRADHDQLIMVAMSGAGQFGPLADMRTYAPTMSSFVGLESLVGYPGELPTGALNFAIGDPNASAHALVAIFGALVRRESTGQGCYIDLSQTEALLATLTPYLLQAQYDGGQPRPAGNAHPGMAPHGIYPVDGDDCWVAIGVRNEDDWLALARVAAGQDWITDPRFQTARDRVAHSRALDAKISSWTALFGRDTLIAELRGAGIPVSSVNDISDLWAHEQLNFRGMIDNVVIPGLGPELLFRAPWNISGIDIITGSAAPVIGSDNEYVFRTLLGLSADDFEAHIASGVIS